MSHLVQPLTVLDRSCVRLASSVEQASEHKTRVSVCFRSHVRLNIFFILYTCIYIYIYIYICAYIQKDKDIQKFVKSSNKLCFLFNCHCATHTHIDFLFIYMYMRFQRFERNRNVTRLEINIS